MITYSAINEALPGGLGNRGIMPFQGDKGTGTHPPGRASLIMINN